MANSKEAAARRKAQRVWVLYPGQLPGGDEGYWYAESVAPEKHGTWGTYNNWYCRCPECCQANAERAAKRYGKEKHGSPDVADE